MKKLSYLCSVLNDYSFTGSIHHIVISQIRTDSRTVQAGDLFVCLVGEHVDGHDFAQNAVEAGAVALVVEKILPLAVPQIVVPDTLVALSQLAAAFYDYPSREIKVLGITGTNGKTTTAFMVRHILETLGERTGLIGTIEVFDGLQTRPAKLTTPLSLEIQQLLRKMVSNGCTYAVMEVSSHALALHRVADIEFYAAGFTNLTQDHLDFHKTIEAYLESKLLLFKKNIKYAVINYDDPVAMQVAAVCSVPILFYSREKQDCGLLYASKQRRVHSKTQLTINYQQQQIATEIAMICDFNVSNALLAMGMVLQCGFSLEQIAHNLKEFPGVPGRFELIHNQADFLVIVDFAHTPDALENVLKTIKTLTLGKLIVVFGCGGDRDRSKRPKMGQVAAKYADYLIITSDNPRSEDPAAIISDIEKGLTTMSTQYVKLVDRTKAIYQAISRAEKGDVVLIAGRGHEQYQKIKDKLIPLDDRIIAAKALEEVEKNVCLDC